MWGELSARDQAWIEQCRKFADQVIEPNYRRYDRENAFPTEVHELARVWNLVDAGFPEELGGQGISYRATVAAGEILGAVCAPIAFGLGSNQSTLHPIVIAGTPDQKQRFIRDLLEERGYASLCFTEEGSGSNLTASVTHAERKGDGWVLNGRKCMVGNGTHATLFIVLADAWVDGEQRGPTLFAVPRHDRVSVGENGDKLGFRAVSTPPVAFDHVEVGDDQLIGEIGGADRLLPPTLDVMRLGGSAVFLGIVVGALRDAAPWLEQRKVAGGPLLDKSHIQLRLGELYGNLEAARIVLWRAAELADRGEAFTREVTLAKLLSSELAMRASRDVAIMFGWRGIDNEYPIQKRFRDAQQTAILEGTSDIQRLTLYQDFIRALRTRGTF
jgi:alkylation response protein AidB-like acyl-CoA dehydrogenase